MNWLGDRIQEEIEENDTVLDVGIGNGNATVPLVCKVQLGIDVWRPWLEKIKRVVPVIIIDIRSEMEKFLDKSFDIVICTDVLEHFEREYAFKLLGDMERIARKKVIIYTPEGFLKQEVPFEGNPFDTHVSGFDKSDFESRGYKITLYSGDKIHDRQYMSIYGVKNL